MEFNDASGTTAQTIIVSRNGNYIISVTHNPFHLICGGTLTCSEIMVHSKYIIGIGWRCCHNRKIYRRSSCDRGRLIFESLNSRIHTRSIHPLVFSKIGFQAVT